MKLIELIFSPLISSEEVKYKVLLLFYYYRYLNRTNLIDLLYIDLITYQIKITLDIKSTLNKI